MIVLIALGFAAIGIMMSYMPDVVPTHYNALGEIDGMGSRYTYLIFPAFSAVSALILIPISRTRPDPVEAKALLYTGIFMVLLFNVMGIFFAYRAMVFESGTASNTNYDIFKPTAITIGVLLVLIGNLMPKFRRNRFSGLRTRWSLSSDSVWQKSNRFAGISAVVCGFLMIICGALFSGTVIIIVIFALIILWAALCTIVSYKYYKSEQQ